MFKLRVMAELTKAVPPPTDIVSAASETKPATNFRWVICALLFWVTTANYVDRGVFGNLAP